MMHNIKLWFRCWKAIATWRHVAEIIILNMENEPINSPSRAVWADELRRNEARIGNCVLTILGIYPLSNVDDWF